MEETEEAKRLRVHNLWQDKINADPWNGWRALLNNWKIEGVSVPVDPNTPFQGYYRSKRQDKTFEPIAFFRGENGKWMCLRPKRSPQYQAVAEGDPDWDRVLESWQHISRRPISHAWYKAVAEENKPWPDADARVTSEALATSDKAAPERTVKIGDNNPPEETPIIALRNKIDNAKGGVADYAKITTEDQQVKARSLKNRLTELKGEGEKEREALSRPYLDALTKIRAEWSPLINDAEAAAKQIVAAMNAYETMLLNRRREDERKTAEVEAERKRVAAENAKLAEKAELDGTEPQYQKLPEQPKPTAPPPRTEVKTAYGRKGSVKAKFVVSEITDAAALFAFLTTPKMHSELRIKMLELAQRAKDAGFEPDGVKIDEVAEVKG